MLTTKKSRHIRDSVVHRLTRGPLPTEIADLVSQSRDPAQTLRNVFRPAEPFDPSSSSDEGSAS